MKLLSSPLLILLLVTISLFFVTCTNKLPLDPNESFNKNPTHSWHSQEWSDYTKSLVDAKFSTLDNASDVKQLCKSYNALTKDQKLNMWVELFSAIAKFESSYDPKAEGVDVGTKENKDTWSVGLLQLSVVDQVNLGLPMGLKYEDLKDPKNNLKLGVSIMSNQIQKRKKVLIPKGEKGVVSVYWAVINPGNKNDKSKEILEMTNKSEGCL